MLIEDCLGREVFEIQSRNALPGLILQNEEHLMNKLNFQVNRSMSKYQWRKLVNQYVRNRNKEQLLQSMKEYKKVDFNQCVNEEFKRKDYFYDLNLDQTRTRFRISSQMLETVRSNFSNKYKYSSLGCQSCKGIINQNNDSHDEPIDSQSHLLTSCLAFSDLRDQFDTESDLGLVNFFTAVIKRRLEEEDN